MSKFLTGGMDFPYSTRRENLGNIITTNGFTCTNITSTNEFNCSGTSSSVVILFKGCPKKCIQKSYSNIFPCIFGVKN